MAEDDETTIQDASPAFTTPASDNSLGRLLTLADGVFAIAMTLLALDLTVPDLGKHPTDADLRHYLTHHASSYLSFLLSFYIVANYWMRHRRLMRSVVTIHPALIRETLILLLLVAAMPFPAGLLGSYGSLPSSLALYGALNVLAVLTLLLLSYDVQRLDLVDDGATADDYAHRWQSWLTLGVFALCIPAGYVLGSHGPYVLLLLSIPARLTVVRRLFGRRRAGRGQTDRPEEKR